MEKAVQNFHGVKHRTQFIKEVNKRRFYNDSKATNIIATQTALRSFINQSVILIAGGLDRKNGFDELVPDLTSVSGIVLYGETKEKLQEAAKVAGVPVIEVVNTLEEATKKAYEISKEEDIILLSPACASWDQFKNFEIRGDEFIRVVENL
ncbi:glutamate ligase domain-containing protein [uncultured Granulicatella sp.]|uniref:glutamate ligase domain-containing protein n=1 Tax=uncultured Granulicatella sp. TaxID=316089 RepID=UPI0028D5A540|nr:cyanophycin synthetase [uncultured Granulicatella sp.]